VKASVPKLVLAAAVVAALVFAGFRLLGDAASPARAVEAPTVEAAEAERPAANAKADESHAIPRWVRDTNALCRAEKRDLEALARPGTIEDFVPYLRRAIRLAERYHRRFRALEVPWSDPRIRRIERANARAKRLLRAMLRAAEHRDTSALLDRAEAAIALAEDASPLLRELGLDDCAMPPAGLAA
jgi:hypothetical protein